MNWIGALIKESPDGALVLFATGGYSKKTVFPEPGSKPSPDTKLASILILFFLASKNINACCLSHLVHLIFVLVARID